MGSCELEICHMIQIILSRDVADLNFSNNARHQAAFYFQPSYSPAQSNAELRKAVSHGRPRHCEQIQTTTSNHPNYIGGKPNRERVYNICGTYTIIKLTDGKQDQTVE